MQKYDHQKIEQKWQDKWQKSDIYQAKDFDKKPKFFCMVEFPYPSGERLHVGHGRSYSALDSLARLKRMQGYNVMFPIGWDAFGLPAENYAIKTGIHPSITTKENIENSKKQLISWGCSFDWSREINTTDPGYYKWTQWIFLKLYDMGLAYKEKMPINWCPSCKTGLANEEVVDGRCERCGAEAESKELDQWMLRITKYADKLLKGLEDVDYLPRIKSQQANWIGRSEGAEVRFEVRGLRSEANSKQQKANSEIVVFTTRPDTLFGATFMVLAPEHPLVSKLSTEENKKAVEVYVAKSAQKSELEKMEEDIKDKTGVFTGSYAINPVNGKEIPIYISDYVLMSYGHGAIMAVPAHDQRDWDFAKKFDIPIDYVVAPIRVDKKNPPKEGKNEKARHTIHGIVYDKKKDKYLVLDWQEFDWTTFIVGGVDEGEDVVDAARREILEETGYKNLKFIRKLGGPVRAEYFAAHKDENRVAYTTGVLFELENDEQEEVSSGEVKKHKSRWTDFKTINEDVMTCAELDIWLEQLSVPDTVFTGEGVAINSGNYDGLTTAEVKEKIIAELSKKKLAKKAVNYKMRDWVFSRQHYWGEPIPIIHCEKCGEVPVPEKDLPVELPMVEKYEPTGTGESPLAEVTDWVNVKCPKCGGEAKRETDTMPNWAGSSWYFIRYVDANNDKELASADKMKYWLPVDLYNGGMEHTTLHLLYSRFWNRALFDAGIVPYEEPYKRRHSHGMILGKDNQKMSKSRGNVVNPDEIVEKFGGDTFRIYEMFIGPFESMAIWDEKGVEGVYRFLNRTWNLFQLPIDDTKPSSSQNKLLNKTIKKVQEDILGFKFNTAVSTVMILTNELLKDKKQNKEVLKKFAIILAPLAPHMAEELWEKLGNKESIHVQEWPEYDKKAIVDDVVTIVVQVNGKVRANLEMSKDSTQEVVEKQAFTDDNVKKFTSAKKPKKVIYVQDKILNIVV